jgi:hypothetical protein
MPDEPITDLIAAARAQGALLARHLPPGFPLAVSYRASTSLR